MKFFIPLVYRVSGMPVRHRTYKDVEHREWVDVDLTEVRSSEAPVAIRVTNVYPTRLDYDRRLVEVVRYFDEGFWYPADTNRPVVVDHLKGISDPETLSVRDLADCEPFFSLFDRLSWIHMQNAKASGPKMENKFDPAGYKDIMVNPRDGLLRELHEKARNLIVIDADNYLARVFLASSKELDGPTTHYHFSPVVPPEEIAAFSDDAAVAFRSDERGVRVNSEIEVLMPEVLDYDIEERALLSFLRHGIPFSWGCEGRDQPFDRVREDPLMLLLQLKTAVFREDPDMEEIEEILPEFVEAASDPNNHVNYSGVLDTMRAGLERWQNRPIRLPGMGMS
jgi:hypothetical protein